MSPSPPVAARSDGAVPGLSEALAATGSAALAGSGLLTWLDLGSESFSGYRMVSIGTALANTFSQAPPAAVILSWYLVPVLGVVSWLALFVRLQLRVSRVHLAIGLLGALIPALFLSINVSTGRPTLGPPVALVGALLIIAGSITKSRSHQ